MSERSFAGFWYQDRLSVGFYGEVFRGRSQTGREVRVLEVDPRLAEQPGFAGALSRFGADLGILEHRNVVSTLSVGRAPGGQLVVVTEPVRGPVSLEEVIRQTDGLRKLPEPVALAISHQVVEALATAHARKLIHGAVHPRSVLIDFNGNVKLTDFAVGRALGEVAALDPESDLLGGSVGFVAPELALGDPPTAASDVYGAGALAFTMLTGDTPPGSLGSTPGLEKVVAWALDTDLRRRYPDAGALASELGEVLDDENWHRASASDIASLVDDVRSDADAHLDAATEDFLAELGREVPAETRPESEPHRQEPNAVVDAETDDVLGELDADPPTQVDETPRGLSRDPVSELIAIERRGDELRLDSSEEDDDTPLPPPTPEQTGPTTRADQEIPIERRERARDAEHAAVAALASLDEEDEPPAPRAVSPTAVVPSAPRRVGTGIWVVTTLLLLGVLAAVLYTQTDLFHPERARREREARRAELEAERRRLEAMQPTPGRIAVDSVPDGAAVWLLLGRTPVESMPLPASMHHDIRLEHDGYRPVDVRVGVDDWSGDGELLQAEISGELVAGQTSSFPPAAPPAPEEPGTGLTGRGAIHITSDPEGAEAWLLVGFTPDMGLEGIEAGETYELKVLKDGFRPGFAVVKAEDWRLGDAPDAGLRDSIERRVELVPHQKSQ